MPGGVCLTFPVLAALRFTGARPRTGVTRSWCTSLSFDIARTVFAEIKPKTAEGKDP